MNPEDEGMVPAGCPGKLNLGGAGMAPRAHAPAVRPRVLIAAIQPRPYSLASEPRVRGGGV